MHDEFQDFFLTREETQPRGPVYVDELFTAHAEAPAAQGVGRRHKHQWCHLWSEDLEELHRIAKRIGLNPRWFQNRPNFPHYDLVPTKRELAIKAGAVPKDLREWIRERRSQSL